MPGSPALRRHPRPVRHWVFFVLAILIGLACIRLGFWQLDRLAERRAANRAAQSQLDREAISLPQDLGEDEALVYRRASARGAFDAAHEVYLSSRPQDGIAGVHVVTPLLLSEAGPAVLVDRGWISEVDFRTEARQSWSIDGPTTVSGMLLPSQGEPAIAFLADRVPEPGEPPLAEWRALSIPGIQAQTPYPLLDVYLVLENPVPPGGSPRPSPDLDLGEGPHLGYAIQWFAFAAIALIGAAVWFGRGPRSPGQGRPDHPVSSRSPD